MLKNGHVPHYLDLRCERCDETMVVYLGGELDIAAEEYFESSLRSLAEEEEGGIVLDLSGLSFMDSTGIRLILQAWGSARRDGSGFAVRLGDSPVRRTLEIAGLDRVLPIAADVVAPSFPVGKS